MDKCSVCAGAYWGESTTAVWSPDIVLCADEGSGLAALAEAIVGSEAVVAFKDTLPLQSEFMTMMTSARLSSSK
jgi:hypothetical protein